MTALAPKPNAASITFRLRRCLVRAVWMALLWLGLNGVDRNSWTVGGPVVLAAAWVRFRAPDVALAEAAVGSGLTGALILSALVRMRRREKVAARSTVSSSEVGS